MHPAIDLRWICKLVSHRLIDGIRAFVSSAYESPDGRPSGETLAHLPKYSDLLFDIGDPNCKFCVD